MPVGLEREAGMRPAAMCGLVCLLLVSGPIRAQTAGPDNAPVPCRITFRNVLKPEEQAELDRIVRAFARGEVLKTGPSEHPVYSFAVADLKALDDMRPRILYLRSGTNEPSGPAVFRLTSARFEAEYATLDIAASVEVIVRFRITPGARLFFKPDGYIEKELTDRVDRNGEVSFPARIRRGQEYIFARVVSGGIEKFIKINVFTQAMTEIEKAAYP
jgi:hypothetical protein